MNGIITSRDGSFTMDGRFTANILIAHLRDIYPLTEDGFLYGIGLALDVHKAIRRSVTAERSLEMRNMEGTHALHVSADAPYDWLDALEGAALREVILRPSTVSGRIIVITIGGERKMTASTADEVEALKTILRIQCALGTCEDRTTTEEQ